MQLSIIIVNWNSKEFLEKAIASVMTNTSGISFEIIVVDSGSFDGCAEMLRARYPRVRFIQSQMNLGFARANNLCLDIARGKVVLFLNPDTELVGHAINELYRQLQRLPVDAIVGPTLLNSDGSVQDTCIRAFPTILNQVLDSDLLRTRFPRARLWGKSALLDNGSLPHRVDAVSGACLMMQRSAFEAIGMFSTEYFMYAEDMDLCLKAGRLGFPCYFAPKAVVVHHGGGSSSQAPANKFSSVMALESQWRFFRKTRSDGYANLYRVAMCLASLLRLGILLLAWPLQKLRAREQSTGNALRKWAARLRWSLGGEQWVQEY